MTKDEMLSQMIKNQGDIAKAVKHLMGRVTELEGENKVLKQKVAGIGGCIGYVHFEKGV